MDLGNWLKTNTERGIKRRITGFWFTILGLRTPVVTQTRLDSTLVCDAARLDSSGWIDPQTLTLCPNTQTIQPVWSRERRFKRPASSFRLYLFVCCVKIFLLLNYRSATHWKTEVLWVRSGIFSSSAFLLPSVRFR